MEETEIFDYEGSQAVPIRPCSKGRLKKRKVFGSVEGGEMRS
jgi:hypothetical protein